MALAGREDVLPGSAGSWLYFYITSVGRAQIFQHSLRSKHRVPQTHLQSGWAAAALCRAKPRPRRCLPLSAPHTQGGGRRQPGGRCQAMGSSTMCEMPRAPGHVPAAALPGQGWVASPACQGHLRGTYFMDVGGAHTMVVVVQVLRLRSQGRRGTLHPCSGSAISSQGTSGCLCPFLSVGLLSDQWDC